MCLVNTVVVHPGYAHSLNSEQNALPVSGGVVKTKKVKVLLFSRLDPKQF